MAALVSATRSAPMALEVLCLSVSVPYTTALAPMLTYSANNVSLKTYIMVASGRFYPIFTSFTVSESPHRATGAGALCWNYLWGNVLAFELAGSILYM